MRARLDKVVGPDVIAVLGPQPDTGAIRATPRGLIRAPLPGTAR